MVGSGLLIIKTPNKGLKCILSYNLMIDNSMYYQEINEPFLYINYDVMGKTLLDKKVIVCHCMKVHLPTTQSNTHGGISHWIYERHH